MPTLDWEAIKNLFPVAITIAVLGAIESLLSATVADGVIGDKHDTREDEQRQCRPSGALPPACFCTVIHCAPSFVTR
mgnify:FL=1